MVGTLRDGRGADLRPQQGVRDLRRLAGDGSGAGPRVLVTIEVDELRPSVDAACFRLAQEAITNALRHAHQASEVLVRVDGDDDHVHVTVVDDGRGSAAPTASTSTCTGPRGFLLKDAGPELLAQAVRSAANGDALLAPSVTARLLSTFSDLNASANRPTTQPLVPLTEREEEALVTVARGRTNAEIADDLCISLSTVKSHLASLMSKLGARNRVELAMWAYETDRIS